MSLLFSMIKKGPMPAFCSWMPMPIPEKPAPMISTSTEVSWEAALLFGRSIMLVRSAQLLIAAMKRDCEESRRLCAATGAPPESDVALVARREGRLARPLGRRARWLHARVRRDASNHPEVLRQLQRE